MMSFPLQVIDSCIISDSTSGTTSEICSSTVCIQKLSPDNNSTTNDGNGNDIQYVIESDRLNNSHIDDSRVHNVDSIIANTTSDSLLYTNEFDKNDAHDDDYNEDFNNNNNNNNNNNDGNDQDPCREESTEIPVIEETNINLLHYNAACRIQTLYYIKQAYYKVKLRKIQQIQEKAERLNAYHEKYLLDLMVARIQKNVRRFVTRRQYKRRMLIRKTHMLPFSRRHLHYYATIIQAWYRGLRTRHQFQLLLHTLLKHRYRRSICVFCQKKATVKRCLLCRADYCKLCFESIHSEMKGTHHDWLYSEAFIRKKLAEVQSVMSSQNQTSSSSSSETQLVLQLQQQGPEYMSDNNTFSGSGVVLFAENNSNQHNNILVDTFNRKYKLNPIHHDGSRNNNRHSNYSNSDYIADGNTRIVNNNDSNDGYSFNADDNNSSLSSVSYSIDDNTTSTLHKKEKSSRRVQFSSSKNNQQQQKQHTASMPFSEHYIDGTGYDDSNDYINEEEEEEEEEEDIVDELLTTSPFDSFITYPLIVTHPQSMKAAKVESTNIDTSEKLITPLYAVDIKGRSIEKNAQFNEYMDFVNLVHGKTNNNNKNTLHNSDNTGTIARNLKNTNDVVTPTATTTTNNVMFLKSATQLVPIVISPTMNTKATSKASFVSKGVTNNTATATVNKMNIKSQKGLSTANTITTATSKISTSDMAKNNYTTSATPTSSVNTNATASKINNHNHNSHSNNSDWIEYFDTSSGYPYWYNQITQESTWNKPS